MNDPASGELTSNAIRRVGLEAIDLARACAEERFGVVHDLWDKSHASDFVTEVDLQAEKEIVALLRHEFPGFRIVSEEAGDLGPTSDYTWLVDPLDGTNNFSLGLPIYGAMMVLLESDRPLAAVGYSTLDEEPLFAWCADSPMIESHDRDPDDALTVSVIHDYKPAKAERIARTKHELEAVARRVLYLWAPTADAQLIQQGRLDAAILFGLDGADVLGLACIARHRGYDIVDETGRPVPIELTSDTIVASRPGLTERLLEIVF